MGLPEKEDRGVSWVHPPSVCLNLHCTVLLPLLLLLLFLCRLGGPAVAMTTYDHSYMQAQMTVQGGLRMPYSTAASPNYHMKL